MKLDDAKMVQALSEALVSARRFFAQKNGVDENAVTVDFAWPDKLTVTMRVPISFDVEDEPNGDEPDQPGPEARAADQAPI